MDTCKQLGIENIGIAEEIIGNKPGKMGGKITGNLLNDGRNGKIIRKLRLDELPQLILVIKGKMSLIGPRPERPEIDNKLEKIIFIFFMFPLF